MSFGFYLFHVHALKKKRIVSHQAIVIRIDEETHRGRDAAFSTISRDG